MLILSIAVALHLADVETELRARDVAALSPVQRAWRAQLLDVLHSYRERGRFPRNDYVPHDSPVFVDRHGTHCAVGYLIAASGRHDLALRIAMARNLARVADLTDDPELVRWLDEHGFTADEAARIQPAYPGPATGDVCYSYDRRDCAEGPCLSVDVQVGYCTKACDLARTDTCPTGPYGAMRCEAQPAGGEPLCVYPMSLPGLIGAACDETSACFGFCLIEEQEPTCTYVCGEELTPCPAGYECGTYGEAAVCRPSDGGCSATGGLSGISPALVLALMLRLRRVSLRSTGLLRDRAGSWAFSHSSKNFARTDGSSGSTSSPESCGCLIRSRTSLRSLDRAGKLIHEASSSSISVVTGGSAPVLGGPRC